jgi:CubicO group peptidase (beta-lactamase class C family)
VVQPDTAPKSAGPDDAAARLARVERGLGPVVRVKGEAGGASIEDRLRAHHTPGVSIAIIHDYRVVSAKAYGVADATTRAPLTDTTMMSAASVSKMITALAALKEVEAGKIPLEADVNQTLRSWRVPENESTRKTQVTLKHLLSHTAGTNVPSVSQEGEPPPTLLELLEGKPPALNRPVRVEAVPGAGFRYSGGGTTIVQQMLVDVERRPFPDVMNDLLLAPFGLTHSSFVTPTKSMATGHDFDASVVDGRFHIWTGAAAGGLWSTPADLARLVAEVQLGLHGKSKLVSKEVATRLTTPILTVAGSISIALGAFVEKHGTGTYWGHDGLGIGFMAMTRASTTDGEGAVVMANGQSAAPLLLEIFRSIAAEYAWEGWQPPPIELAHVDPAHLAALSGRYGADKSESTIVTVKGDHLEAKQPFRKPLELLAITADVFVSREEGIKFTFSNGSLVREAPAWPPTPPAAPLMRLPDGAPLETLQLLESGRTDDALALAKKRLEAEPKDPTLDDGHLRDIGEDLLDELDPKGALPVLQLNLALHPQSPMASVEVAEALFRAGRRADAVPFYTKAKSLYAADPTAMNERLAAYFIWRVFRLKALDQPRL